MNFFVLGVFLVVALAIGLGIQALNNRSALRGTYRPDGVSGAATGGANTVGGKTFWVTGYAAGESGESFTLHHGLRAKTAVEVRLTVRADGLCVCIGGATAQVYPLREVLSVHQKTTQVSVNGHPAETKFLHTITFTDGLSLTAKGEFRDPDRVRRHADGKDKPELRFAAFIADLDRRIAADRLPDALSTLRQGGAIAFGDITIDYAGVGGQGRVLPWSVITEVTAYDGRLTIGTAARGERIQVLVEQLPNLHLLIDAINHQRSS
ncbi:DUF6585 family protein [Nocardia sp. NPDC051981]|uniref:DUF6585 family protein n=1 Tax=Nocardia sp. NPDC051981 TaxID=3155417 RepID=UPI0034435CCA